jgi:hypothetical protein
MLKNLMALQHRGFLLCDCGVSILKVFLSNPSKSLLFSRHLQRSLDEIKGCQELPEILEVQFDSADKAH